MATTVKLSDGEAGLVRSARDEIMQRGIAKLEDLQLPCPQCGKTMSGMRVTAEHWECEKCGYSQDGINLGVGGALALGAVVGAGIVALMWYLSKQASEK